MVDTFISFEDGISYFKISLDEKVISLDEKVISLDGKVIAPGSENAKPRRSAGGAQLKRSLGEFEGPIGDLDLSNFAKDYQVSSAESGSGEPSDRAQICAML